MLKTYRIIPLIFILFLFGFTLITASPVFAQGKWDKSMGMRHPDRPCMDRTKVPGGCGPDMRSPELIKSDPYDTNNPMSQEARANQADSPKKGLSSFGRTPKREVADSPKKGFSSLSNHSKFGRTPEEENQDSSNRFERHLQRKDKLGERFSLKEKLKEKKVREVREAVIQLHRDDALECSKNRPENEMRIGRFCAGQKARDIQNGIMAHVVPHVKIDGEHIYCNQSEAERNHQLLLNSCMKKRARTAGYACVWTVVKMDGHGPGKHPRWDCTSYRIMKERELACPAGSKPAGGGICIWNNTGRMVDGVRWK